MSGYDLYGRSEDYANLKWRLVDDKARKEGAEKCTILNPKSVTCSIIALAIQSQAADSNKEQELTILDDWKDNYVGEQDCGRYSIQQYHAVSSAMITALEDGSAEKAQEIYDAIYNNVVTPCINCIKQNENEKAYSLCREKLDEIFKRNFDAAEV